MENSRKLSVVEFLADIRYVFTSPAQRFSVILERGALWGSILLLIAPVYLGFSFAGGVYFDREPFPGYSLLLPAVLAAASQLIKAYLIHFFCRLFEGRGRFSAAAGRFRSMLTVFGYSTVPGTLAAILAAILFFLIPEQFAVAMRDFRTLMISIFIAIAVGLFIWNLILLVLALRPVYLMRDLKIVSALIIGSILAILPAFAMTLVAVPVRAPYAQLQTIISPRMLGFMASGPEQSQGKEARISIHVDRLVYRFKMPARFDLIAYDPLPDNSGKAGQEETSKFPWQEKFQSIGRIVGIPGDTVELAGGQLRINGQAWAEPYIPADFQSNASISPVTLGPSEYLVLPGDRRVLESKKDGWVVPRSRITGRLPISRWPMGWRFFRSTAFLRAYPLTDSGR